MSERKWLKDPVVRISLGITALSYVLGGAALAKSTRFEEDPRADNLAAAARQIDPEKIFRDKDAQDAISSALQITGDEGELDDHLRKLSKNISESENIYPDSYEVLQLNAVKKELMSKSSELEDTNYWQAIAALMISAGSIPAVATGVVSLQLWLGNRHLRMDIEKEQEEEQQKA